MERSREAMRITVSGSLAQVADGPSGLRVIDVSRATRPREVSAYDTPRTARSVQVVGAHAYVGDLKWLRVIDISNPSAPREIASYKTPSYAHDIQVSDGTAYVANYDAGLMILALKRTATHLSEHHLHASVPVR